MHQILNKKSVTNSEIGFYNSLVSCKQIRMVQSYYFICTCFRNCKRAVSLPRRVVNLNSRESNKIYFSASISTLFIAPFLLGNLFCAKY